LPLLRTLVLLATVPVALASAQEMEGRGGAQAQALSGSVHRTLRCANCHGHMSSEMGGRPDPITTCTACHTAQGEAFSVDGHQASFQAGNAAAPTCVSCHGSHEVLSRRDAASPSHPANLPVQCGACHSSSLRTYQEGVHSAELERAHDLRAATCTSCHTAHRVARATFPWSSVAPARVASTCAGCHLEAGAQYAPSVHAIAAARGAPHAGTCVDCHGSHAIPQAAAASSPTSVLQVSEATCARCHQAVELTETHRLEASVVQDFRGSFHGLAGALGDRRVANCASCHGYHEVRPSWDPQSTVNPTNLATTCGRCHTGAGPRFARGGVHHLPRTFGHRLVGLARVMYVMMIIGIVGLMLLHNGLDFVRRWRDKRTRPEIPPPTTGVETRRYRRFTLNERLQHWTLAASFIVLAVSGFALVEQWRVPWVSAQTGTTVRAVTHRVAAVVFMVLALYHLGYVIFTKRGRATIRAMVPRLRSAANLVCCAASCLRLGPPSTSDWHNLIQTVKYNLGRAPERPRQGRFTYAEKMEYFALAWGAVVMITTGLALWFEVPFLNRFPFWTFELATVVHLYEALLASLAIVVWHFYFTMFNPDVFPMSKAMTTGQVTREEMEREHAEELCGIDCQDNAGPEQPSGGQLS
jgi:cytochrome b subunit of formate dehydrogenase